MLHCVWDDRKMIVPFFAFTVERDDYAERAMVKGA
jgi:hypothetical protein